MLLVLLLKAYSLSSENPSNFIKINPKEGILMSCQAGKWLHLSDLCVCKAGEQEWKLAFFSCFPDALGLIAELNRMMKATAH